MVGGTAVIPGRPACQALHPCPAPGHLLPGKNFRWPGGSLTSDQWHRAPRALRGTHWANTGTSHGHWGYGQPLTRQGQSTSSWENSSSICRKGPSLPFLPPRGVGEAPPWGQPPCREQPNPAEAWHCLGAGGGLQGRGRPTHLAFTNSQPVPEKIVSLEHKQVHGQQPERSQWRVESSRTSPFPGGGAAQALPGF